MTYQRKTRDEWEVQGWYGKLHGWECVTTEDRLLDIRERLREYRKNEPGVSFRLRMKRVSLEGA